MASNTENVKLGVCNVYFDGIDLGYTKGGVEVEVATATHEVTVDQHGSTPISEFITGRSVSVKVPLAETTLENLVLIMPGSTLVTDGVRSSGTVTFATAAPVNSDSVTLAGTAFTFKTVPVNPNDIAIPGSVNAAAVALADAINNSGLPFSAVAALGVVTITAKQRGVAGNVTLAKVAATPANIAVSGATLTGGVDVTKARVDIRHGINVNLLSVAKKLMLRPVGTTGADDFVVHKAACPGALTFAYQTDAERIYSANFKGYVADATGKLASVGDAAAA